MPIVANNFVNMANNTAKAAGNTIPDLSELYAKRAARDQLRTKYTVVRKNQDPPVHKEIKLMIDGKEVPISDSAKYMLEEMIATANTGQK